MIKLLLCMICGFAIAIAMLQMRQQQLELKHKAAMLQAQVQSRQSRLWQQQLQIAIYTAPNAVAKMVGGHDLDLKPEAPLPEEVGNWMVRAETKK